MKLVANGSRSQIIEELATVKTLRGIGAWLEKRILGTTAAACAIPTHRKASGIRVPPGRRHVVRNS